MTWQDRVRRGAYTSPGGTRIEFDCSVVSRSTSKRTAAFDFPGVDGAYVQDNGHSSRTYPLRCYFNGDDHDLQATAFEAALLERGEGRLEHPFYGTFDVVPYGEISRRDDLVQAANESVVEVTFWTTVGALYPQSQLAPRSELLTALDGFSAAAAEQYADGADLSTTLAQETTRATVSSMTTLIMAKLEGVAKATPAVAREVDAQLQKIELGTSVIFRDPGTLAAAVTALVLTPARAASAVNARLTAYADLAQGVFDSVAGNPGTTLAGGIPSDGRRMLMTNDFLTADHVAMAAVAGSIRSVIETRFSTKPEAIAAAESILTQVDALVAWRDQAYADLEAVDHGGAYQALQTAAALAAGYLVQVSFSLVPERRIVLDRARTIIDLAAELYGTVDSRLDFLISTNELTGSEILELPSGKTIVYYA